MKHKSKPKKITKGPSSVYRGKKIATPEGSRLLQFFEWPFFCGIFLDQRPTIVFCHKAFMFLVYCHFLVSILWPSKYEDIPLFSKNDSPPVSDLIPLILAVNTTLPKFSNNDESKWSSSIRFHFEMRRRCRRERPSGCFSSQFEGSALVRRATLRARIPTELMRSIPLFHALLSRPLHLLRSAVACRRLLLHHF